MSRYVLTCTIDPDRLDVLARLRAEHYAFLLTHRDAIVFGGPARVAEGGAPEEMIIVVEVPDRAAAQAFLDAEPYHRHGGFRDVRVRPWSQVLPELTPGALEATYAAERAARG